MLDKVTGEMPDKIDTSTELTTATDASTEVAIANESVAPVSPQSPRPSSGLRVIITATKGILQLVLMIAVLAGASFWMRDMIAGKPEPKKRPVFQSVFTVEAVEAKLADHQPQFSVFGTVSAARSVDLRAISSGEIVAVNDGLQVGRRVEQGAVLAEIDRFQYEGALSEAKANLAEVNARLLEKNVRIQGAEAQIENTRKQLAIARDDLVRAEQLLIQGTLTSKDVENRRLAANERELALTQRLSNIEIEKAGIAQLEAQLERFQWKIEQAERNLKNTKLIAPFTGVIQSAAAEVGRNAGNDVLVSIYDNSQLDAKFTLNDSQYGRLAASDGGLIGRDIEAVWNVGGEDFVFNGKISRLGAQISSERGGVELFASLDPASAEIAVRPGAFVEIRVRDTVFKNSAKLPESALYNGDHIYVLVDGKLQRRDVRVRSYEGDFAIVQGPLNNGDRVLNTRLAQISEGTKVRTADEPEPVRGRPANASTSDKGNGADAKPAETAQRGGQGGDRAELAAKVRAENNISQEAWDAMKRPERRKLIEAYRNKQSN